ncbi:MAG: murein L,D-transpeptidase [Armatimonadetes bacterium]|nr:murein L,D-transpeptidase [Armatimonadota bacterium]
MRVKAIWSVIFGAVGMLAVGTVTYAMVSFHVTGATPADQACLGRNTIPITVSYAGLPGTVSLAIDGSPLEVRDDREKKMLIAEALNVPDGAHAIDLVVRQKIGFSEVRKSWQVNVDTRPPRVTLYTPKVDAIVKESPCKINGHTEAGTKLTVAVSPSPVDFKPSAFTADEKGYFSTYVPLAENQNTVRLDAVDRSGNRTISKRTVVCDRTAPAVTNPTKTRNLTLEDAPTVTLKATIVEKGSGIRRATIKLDAHPAKPVEISGSGEIVWSADDLPQGEREITLEVEDVAGWMTTHRWNFLVDTTETFGRAQMTRGARGKDVARLQKRLVKRGFLTEGEVTSLFDERTEWALKQFQMQQKMEPDGMAGYKTIAELSPKIYINLDRFSLLLVDGGNKVKSYGVAHGMPEYPTPAGDFHVMFLEKDPTWIPPRDSLWAREAKMTPPGPGNPLGTRWIGLDSAAVGIHGTPSAWSIGSRASHGCIRMRIFDVEDLFERVNEGMEVVIFWERDRKELAKKYWAN